MSTGLTILPAGALDFVSVGALVHRLDSGIVPFRSATECQIHVSGGEFNCAANLSHCFGLKTGIVSAMADYPVGELIAGSVKAMGVTPFYKHFKHNGVNGPNMATVYSDRGQGVRAPVVFYNRSNEAGGLLKAGDFNWQEIFSGGVRWFHSGGIFAALSQTTPEVIIEGMQAAKAAGAAKSKLDPSAFFGMIDNVIAKHPQIKIVATTLRDVHSTNRHSWSAVAWVNGKTHIAPTAELDVYDRIGGGDGFASGFFYGLLTGEAPQDALKLGWAHGALLTTFPGDISMASVDEVRAFASGGSARVQR